MLSNQECQKPSPEKRQGEDANCDEGPKTVETELSIANFSYALK